MPGSKSISALADFTLQPKNTIMMKLLLTATVLPGFKVEEDTQ
jgi:hypothetical protein